MTLSDFLNDLKNKLVPPTFQPQPQRFTYAAPRPQPVPISATIPANQGLDASESATLVAGSSHKSGISSDNRASLVGGR